MRGHQSYLEFAITHDCTSKLCVKILLVCHTRTKSLLTKHFPQSRRIIIRIISNDFAGFWVMSFELESRRI
jgi:hypothetical protein